MFWKKKSLTSREEAAFALRNAVIRLNRTIRQVRKEGLHFCLSAGDKIIWSDNIKIDWIYHNNRQDY